MDTIMSRAEDTSIQLCRLCLRNTTGCVSLFADLFDSEDVELPKIVKSCVGVEVRRGDGFTCMVCGPCHKMVLKFHDFKSTCLESQWRLMNMPRWAAEGPRDPLEGTDEVDVGKRPGLGAAGIVLRGASSQSSGKSDTSDKAGGKIWPVAVWTVYDGCWRANTCNSEETIISDLIEDDNKSTAVNNQAISSRVDGGNGGASPSCRSTDSPTLDTANMDHTYSTQPTEPLQLCSVVMEHLEDDEEEEIAVEDWGVKKGVEKEETSSSNSSKLDKKTRETRLVSVMVGNKPVGVVKEFADTKQKTSMETDKAGDGKVVSHSQQSVLKQISSGKVISISREQVIAYQKRWALNQRPLLPKPSNPKGVVKSHVLSAKLSNGKLLLKNNGSDAVQKIVIKAGSSVESKIKHIPMVKGLRLTSGLMIPNGSRCSILKVKKVNR